MPAAVPSLARPASINDTSAFIARIEAGDDNHALVARAADAPTERHVVLDHAAGVTPSVPGDRVVAQPVRGGVVILAALDGDNGVQRLPDGRLLVDGSDGVVIQAGPSRVELRPDGRLLLHGRELEQRADRVLSLQASLIEIN